MKDLIALLIHLLTTLAKHYRPRFDDKESSWLTSAHIRAALAYAAAVIGMEETIYA